MADEQKSKLRLEIAHVLFIDIVGYSKLLTEEQSEALQELNQIVRNTEAAREAEASGQLIILPTGDGMALVFTGSVEGPAECALEVSQALQAQPSLPVRMGIHSGPVHHLKDANARENISGVGINIAQRVMDCGDAGHILVSKRFADDLAQHRRWQRYLHELGDVEVKHGVVVSLVNLYAETIGNPAPPARVAGVRRSLPGSKRRKALSPVALAIFIIAVLLLALAIASVIFAPTILRSLDRQRAATQPQPSATASPSLGDAIKSMLTKKVTDELQKSFSASNPGDESPAAASIAPEKSVAVLPFDNRSEDKANAYFADGIQDEILTRLAAINDLKVISRTSTLRYKTAPENLAQVGKQLGVAHLVEGSVQKSGDQVRINVQLIRAADDSHIWAETFDRKLTNIFTVESEVAAAIADKLKVKLTGSEQRSLSQQPTANLEAYDAYLRGLATHFIIWDLGRLQNAEKYFRHAVDLDPGFGLAWARLANVHSIFYFADFDATRERREAARTAADMALKLAPESGEAYLALGVYRLRCERNFRAAAEALEIARQRLPNNAEPLLELGAVAGQSGRFDEALAKQRAALALDPRNPSTIRRNGVFEAYFRHLPEAHAYIDRALEITPDDSALIGIKADLYQSEGKLAAAEQTLARLPPQLAPEQVTETCSQMRQLLYQRRYDAVIKSLYPIAAGPPPSVGTRLSEYYILLAIAQRLAGDLSAAHDTYEKGRDFLLAAIAKNGETQGRVHAMLGQMYAGLGQESLALKEAETAIELEGEDKIVGPGAQEARIRIELLLGDKNASLAHLPQLLTTRYHSWFYFFPITPALLKLDPTWDSLRGDPRFEKLVTSQAEKDL